jgi:hypothetical protein
MNLREISLRRELSQSPGLHDIERLFKKYNWRFLGRGMEASVAEHPNKKYVLKVFSSRSQYRLLVNLARSHVNNPHFPKFYGKIKTIPGHKSYNFIRMEKLDSIPSHDVLYTLFLSEMLYLYTKSEYYDLGLDLGYDLRVGIYNRYRITIEKALLIKDEIWDMVPKPSGAWMQATNLVCGVAHENREMMLDIHFKNFMTRNGILVYLDPFF